jgi:hypothetical protein
MFDIFLMSDNEEDFTLEEEEVEETLSEDIESSEDEMDEDEHIPADLEGEEYAREKEEQEPFIRTEPIYLQKNIRKKVEKLLAENALSIELEKVVYNATIEEAKRQYIEATLENPLFWYLYVTLAYQLLSETIEPKKKTKKKIQSKELIEPKKVLK